MIELVIVSRLLEYPDAALWQHQQEMFEAIAASKNLSKEDAHALGIFLRDLTAMDPLDAQAQYSELFIFRLHLVLGMTLFLLFPFSRLVHIWSVPVEYLTRKYQLVRARH